MSRKCVVTGKKAQVGHRVSHAQNKTKRRFYVNIRERRFWLSAEKRWVRVKVSAAAIREIDKKGFDAVYASLCTAKAC